MGGLHDDGNIVVGHLWSSTSNTTGHYLVLRIRCMILLRSNNFHGLIKKDEASLINPAITVKLFMGPSVYQ